jgi:hypothetical protein
MRLVVVLPAPLCRMCRLFFGQFPDVVQKPARLPHDPRPRPQRRTARGAPRQARFKPCTPAQPLALGWVPALGEGAQTLVHSADGRLLLCLRREEKILPPSVVRDLLKERIEGIEAQQGRKVYRKERSP